MTIYPIILIIVLCVMWTHDALSINKDSKINVVYTWVWTICIATLLWSCGFFHVIHWPQITWICMNTIGCMVCLYKHGGTMKVTLGNYLFTLTIAIVVYIKGGAFQYLNN